jgi:hypothetical protein
LVLLLLLLLVDQRRHRGSAEVETAKEVEVAT